MIEHENSQEQGRAGQNGATERVKRYSGGRPSMVVPEVRKTIKRALLAGNSFEAAARAGGVQSRALYRWFRLYPDFRKKCEPRKCVRRRNRLQFRSCHDFQPEILLWTPTKVIRRFYQ
jgi:hypothetical protein